MTEVDYQYECSRAELLGLPKPSREEFLSRKREITEEKIEDEPITAEQAQDEGIKQEGFRRIGGGLDELNSILTSTQKKLNRFKMVFGSFGNLLKLHVGDKKEEGNEMQVEVVDMGGMVSENKNPEEAKNSDLSLVQDKKGEDPQLIKLGSLISKAERAEISLSHQNKQMKKFLN